MNLMNWLEDWYCSRADGDWEHSYGVKIDTLDNPGWAVEIDILDTPIEEKAFSPVWIDNSDDDWISCKVENGKFYGCGGPKKLSDIIAVFKDWVESE